MNEQKWRDSSEYFVNFTTSVFKAKKMGFPMACNHSDQNTSKLIEFAIFGSLPQYQIAKE